ncbi:MAG TPA: NADP-dependent isocitrate dehydrogenase [Planctomycetaceae bacterium]|nr:NADP-dependent isocitrate dehydrogenase [Planctomycetaceae bacterium]HRE98935.1 NADP-dependent isocitrate dehydrogenase [Pirellulaceae bacterium]
MSVRVVVAEGDGVGPEITRAVLKIIRAAEAPIEWEPIRVGQAIYEQGNTSGVPADAWGAIRRHGVLLKGPITTPQGKGFKSVNVTIRKALNLFANVRPCKAYAPFVASPHPGMNLVIVRENEEDLYAGIEHRQTPEVRQVLKLVTRPGCEKIIRYAFEYARAYGRRKVSCMTKDNIMKQTDGLFHQVFDEVAAEYPEIEANHFIIDIGAARLAASPEIFDVIVTLNLYGDILSDIAAQIAGSVGFASSANVGEQVSMFEAVHGSAPDIAGRGIANPSGLLIAATQLLVHVGLSEQASVIKNAWLRTLEDGIHTPDVHREAISSRKVGTDDFAEAIIERLGSEPRVLEPVRYRTTRPIQVSYRTTPTEQRLVGVDVFLGWDQEGRDPNVLAEHLHRASTDTLRLGLITNRGVKVYPDGLPETFRTDHWRCRFKAEADEIPYARVIELLQRIDQAGLRVIKTENLYTFDGSPGFSLGQGE